MEPVDILKITAKSAPIPTLAAILVYIIFPKVIESNSSQAVLILVSTLTFLVILAMFIYSSLRSAKKSKTSFSGNSISNIKTGDGDVFIGDKKGNNEKSDFSENKIDQVTAESGDVFIGTKK